MSQSERSSNQTCPDRQTLINCIGMDSEPPSLLIRQHLRTCSRCQKTIDELTCAPELKKILDTRIELPQEDGVAVSHLKLRLKAAISRELESAELSKPANSRSVCHNTPSAQSPLTTLRTDVGRNSKPSPALREDDLDQAALPGEIGRFEVLELLGRGGMGAVYFARDRQLGRHVAIKTINNFASQEARSRIDREAQAIARLNSEHVVRLFSTEQDSSGKPFLVMEHVAGGSLAQHLRDSVRIDPVQAAKWCAETALGLKAAHEAGVLHRDIKPGNILVTQDGRAKVGDFGVAILEEPSATLTRTGMTPGTPAYLSPELAAGKPASERSDIYGLGCVLYELLTGVAPYQGTPFQILQQLRERDPTPPRKLNENIPLDLETICLKAISREPANRYLSASEFRADLLRWLGGESILARPTTRFEKLLRWTRRNPRIAILSGMVAGLLVALVAGSQIALFRIARENQQTRLANKAAEQRAAEANRLRGIAVEQLNDLIDRTNSQLRSRPGALPLRRSLLESALKGLEQIANAENQQVIEKSNAIAFLRMGEVNISLGNQDAGKANLETALSIASALHQQDPDDAEACRNLAAVLMALGGFNLDRNNTTAAQPCYDDARELYAIATELDIKDPRPRSEMAMALVKLGDIEMRARNLESAGRRFAEARASAESAVELNPADKLSCESLATSVNRLTWLALRAGKANDAEPLAMKWRSLTEALLLEDPENMDYQRDLALSLTQFAKIHLLKNEIEQAIECSEQATKQYQTLAELDPRNTVVESNLAVAQYAEGSANFAANKLDRAQELWQSNVAIHRGLFDRHPTATRYAHLAADTLLTLAILEMHRGDVDAAIRYVDEGLELYERLVPAERESLKQNYDGLVKCREEWHSARSLMRLPLEEILSANPKDALICAYLKAIDGQNSDSVKLMDYASDAITNDQKDAGFYFVLAGANARLIEHETDAEAKESFILRALDSLEKTVAQSPGHADFIRTDPDFIPLRGMERYQKILKLEL